MQVIKSTVHQSVTSRHLTSSASDFQQVAIQLLRPIQLLFLTARKYTKKTSPFWFCDNFVRRQSISVIFDTNIAESINNRSFLTCLFKTESYLTVEYQLKRCSIVDDTLMTDFQQVANGLSGSVEVGLHGPGVCVVRWQSRRYRCLLPWWDAVKAATVGHP